MFPFKEIGFPNYFVLRKSSQIVKIEMLFTKRHLPIYKIVLIIFWFFFFFSKLEDSLEGIIRYGSPSFDKCYS